MTGGKLYVDKDSEFQFIDSVYVAKIILNLLTKSISNETFNMAGKGLVRISDVARNFNLDINEVDNAPLIRYQLNIDKIEKIINMPYTKSCVDDYILKYLKNEKNN